MQSHPQSVCVETRIGLHMWPTKPNTMLNKSTHCIILCLGQHTFTGWYKKVYHNFSGT